MGIVKKLKLLRCKLMLWPHKNIEWGNNSTFGRGTVFWAPNHMTPWSGSLPAWQNAGIRSDKNAV